MMYLHRHYAIIPGGDVAGPWAQHTRWMRLSSLSQLNEAFIIEWCAPNKYLRSGLKGRTRPESLKFSIWEKKVPWSNMCKYQNAVAPKNLKVRDPNRDAAPTAFGRSRGMEEA